jgi:hypothetical protein
LTIRIVNYPDGTARFSGLIEMMKNENNGGSQEEEA